jgi:hypothetical protein
MDNPKSRSVKMVFKAPEMIIPNPPVKAYFLRIDIYYGQELPAEKGMLHFQIGPYFRKSIEIKSVNGIFEWNKTIEFNRVLLPVDSNQIPDLVIYFADQDYESHRKCYFRLKASKMLNKSKKKYEKEFQRPTLIRFREDKTLDLVSDDQFSGFVILRPVLFGYEPPLPIQFKDFAAKMIKYNLRVMFYVGRNLPSALDGGTCNPFVVVRCRNKVVYSSIKRDTLNPEWYECKEITIEIPDVANKDSPSLALVVMVYHCDDPNAKLEELYKSVDESGKEDEKESAGFMEQIKDQFTSKPKIVLLGRYWAEVNLEKKKIYRNTSKLQPE